MQPLQILVVSGSTLLHHIHNQGQATIIMHQEIRIEEYNELKVEMLDRILIQGNTTFHSSNLHQRLIRNRPEVIIPIIQPLLLHVHRHQIQALTVHLQELEIAEEEVTPHHALPVVILQVDLLVEVAEEGNPKKEVNRYTNIKI
jgi:hypothetical protein